MSRFARHLLKSVRSIVKPELLAGGIVVRRERGEPLVLVVSARKRRKRWVLPKGTIRRSESGAQAALREVREEAGVCGRVVGPAGSVSYTTGGRRTRVDYYLIEYTRPCDGESEDRKVEWCPVEDAIALLSYASARRMVLEAHKRITALARKK